MSINLAKGSVNLTVEQGLPERIKTVEKLESLQQLYQSSKEIALELAKGYFNLLQKQPFPESTKTEAKLKKLIKDYNLLSNNQ